MVENKYLYFAITVLASVVAFMTIFGAGIATKKEIQYRCEIMRELELIEDYSSLCRN